MAVCPAMSVEPLDGRLFGPGQPCFGCGPDHPIGFRLAFVREGDDVVTHFTPGERYQGPPGIMHGGLVMTLADEVAAWAVLATTGKFGFTAGIEARLPRAVRIGQEVEARARVTKPGTRMLDVGVTLLQDGETAFDASVRFVLLSEAAAQQLLGGPLPEDWKRFCR